jgi:hypothetical protein
MIKRFDYAERAEDCALHAATAANDQARDVWRKMEAYWRKRNEETSRSILPVKESVAQRS